MSSDDTMFVTVCLGNS